MSNLKKYFQSFIIFSCLLSSSYSSEQKKDASLDYKTVGETLMFAVTSGIALYGVDFASKKFDLEGKFNLGKDKLCLPILYTVSSLYNSQDNKFLKGIQDNISLGIAFLIFHQAFKRLSEYVKDKFNGIPVAEVFSKQVSEFEKSYKSSSKNFLEFGYEQIVQSIMFATVRFTTDSLSHFFG